MYVRNNKSLFKVLFLFFIYKPMDAFASCDLDHQLEINSQFIIQYLWSCQNDVVMLTLCLSVRCDLTS